MNLRKSCRFSWVFWEVKLCSFKAEFIKLRLDAFLYGHSGGAHGGRPSVTRTRELSIGLPYGQWTRLGGHSRRDAVMNSFEGRWNRVPLPPMKKLAWRNKVDFRSLEIFINLNQFRSVESGCETIGLDDSFHNLRRQRIGAET